MIRSSTLSESHAKETTPGEAAAVKWVIIAIVGWAEAEVMRSKLDAAGIPCLLQREAAGAALGITIGALGEVRVMAPEELADQAAELLNEPANGEGATGGAGDDDEWSQYEVEGGRKS